MSRAMIANETKTAKLWDEQERFTGALQNVLFKRFADGFRSGPLFPDEARALTGLPDVTMEDGG